MPSLKFELDIKDLNSPAALLKLDGEFLSELLKIDSHLYDKLIEYRERGSNNIPQLELSKFLLELAQILDEFLAEFFDIDLENMQLLNRQKEFDPIYECRRKFIQRYALKKFPKNSISEAEFAEISRELKEILGRITELALAESILTWQKSPEARAHELGLAARYSAYMVHNNSSLMLFDVPMPVDPDNHVRSHKINQLKESTYLGFDYRDFEQSLDKSVAHAKYCIYCHEQGKDSCRTGLAKAQPEKYTDSDAKGCPLDQKISEMNLLKDWAYNIGALAMTVIDNPLVAATGHRICNDCMKSCIYQKQDPVNVPLVESNILEEVLDLPWGVEIYLLLTKWNPLNIDAPLPKSPSGYNILVTGMGPAGFALSHYLLQEGHNVLGIDGLKISPLPFDAQEPIKNWGKIKVELSKREPQGFGGVAEYGITNRWDKNNLTLIRLILERRKNFSMQGGVRLGSNLTTNQAFEMGFDHIALCLGAGRPNFLNHSDYFAKGVRSAADFLMNLQQGGTFLEKTSSKLQIRMPAVVIGCGLTAIDSAVELLHYYPLQVEYFLQKWEARENPEEGLAAEELEVAREFVQHAKRFRAARTAEEKLKILEEIGGVTICYRKTITESPAYLRNHEEIEQAIAVGVKFEEKISPRGLKLDEFGHVKAAQFDDGRELPARTVLVAIGTGRNELSDISIETDIDSDIFKTKDGKISYFGDCNEAYAGSVVKALASAKNGHAAISNRLRENSPRSLSLKQKDLKSYIQDVQLISEDLMQLQIHSPLVAKHFKPGHIYKLQNYANGMEASLKPLALTPANVDKESGILTFFIRKAGKTTSLCFALKKGQEVMLMGPVGAAHKFSKGKKVVVIGAGMVANATLVPYIKELKKHGCHVTYFAGYSSPKEVLVTRQHIHGSKLADQVIWSARDGEVKAEAENEIGIKGSILEAIKHTQKRGMLDAIDQVICNGSAAFSAELYKRKQELFDKAEMLANIYAPMQCMMKGICGQCIVKVDDERGYIFSCSGPEQEADKINFELLEQRLAQNVLLEKF